MDYIFFQNLTDKIDKAKGEEKKKLEGLRETLLDYVNEVDRQIEARYKQAQAFVEKLLEQEDVAKAARDNLENFTQETVELVGQMLRQASEKNDYVRMGKLQKVMEVLQEASAPPPEVDFIERLLEAPDAAAMEKLLNENEAMVNDDLLSTLTGLMAQVEQAGPGNAEAQAVGEKLQQVYKAVLRFSMKKKMGS